MRRSIPRTTTLAAQARPPRSRVAGTFVVAAALTRLLICSGARAAPQDPKASQPGLAEARSLDQQGRFEEAIHLYRDLLHREPSSPNARLGLANDLARRGECADALDSASAATGLLETARLVVEGMCDFRANDLPAAIGRLEKAVAAAPGDKQAAIFLGRAYAASGKPEQGVRVLKAWMATGGDDPDGLYWTGVFYDQLAQQTYDGMVKSHPESYLVLETQGDQLLQRQKYDEALEAYRKALSLAPSTPGLHFNLGNTYWRMAKLDQAALELAAELKLNSAHAQANYELGDIAVKQGDVDRGLALLNKALALNPALIEAHRSLGRAHLSKREYEEALRQFSIVERAQPADHTIHALLASVYQRMGRTREAAEETRKSNELIEQEMKEVRQSEIEQGRDGAPDVPAGPDHN